MCRGKLCRAIIDQSTCNTLIIKLSKTNNVSDSSEVYRGGIVSGWENENPESDVCTGAERSVCGMVL